MAEKRIKISPVQSKNIKILINQCDNKKTLCPLSQFPYCSPRAKASSLGQSIGFGGNKPSRCLFLLSDVPRRSTHLFSYPPYPYPHDRGDCVVCLAMHLYANARLCLTCFTGKIRICYNRCHGRAISSVGERFLHTEEVVGSIPSSPTISPCLHTPAGYPAGFFISGRRRAPGLMYNWVKNNETHPGFHERR